MTKTNLDTMSQVVDLLRGFYGLHATLEYPGFIAIPHAVRKDRVWAWGTANRVWGGDVTYHDGGQTTMSHSTHIPATSTDVALIADTIARVVR